MHTTTTKTPGNVELQKTVSQKQSARLQLQKVHSGATLELSHDEYAGADVKLSLKRARLQLQICIFSCKPVLCRTRTTTVTRPLTILHLLARNTVSRTGLAIRRKARS